MCHIRIASALVILSFLGGCARQGSSPVSQDTIAIGWIGPLTGDAAVLGADNVVAAQMAVDHINAAGGIAGKPLRLIVEDDRYQTMDALSAYEKLVHVDGVRILLMETYSGVLAVADRAKQDGVTIIDTLDCNSRIVELGPQMFCLGVESESIARLLSTRATQEHYKKVGVLFFNSDDFMPYVKDVFMKTFKGEVVAEGYEAKTSDFRTLLYRMNHQGIDAMAFLGYDELGNAMSQARELGMTVPFLAPGTMTSPGWQEAAGGATEGTAFTFWEADANRPTTKAFVDEFVKRRGRQPFVQLFTYPAYDAIISLADALRVAGRDDANAFREALHSVRGEEGITGTISFAKDGSMRIPFKLYRWTEGKPQVLR